MPTFKRIEVVDARQFTGGKQNGTDLVFWVNANGGQAYWLEATQGLPEQVKLAEQPYSQKYGLGYAGDWIMQNQDGSFKVVRQQELDAQYEQV
jgi:hypothetical protein